MGSGRASGPAQSATGGRRGRTMASLKRDPGRAAIHARPTFLDIVQRGGAGAQLAAEEFFAARFRNPHTRRAYGRHVVRFLEWCDARGLELREVSPGDAARFIEELAPSVANQKIALAALRQFFDLLVTPPCGPSQSLPLRPGTAQGLLGREDARDQSHPGPAALGIRRLLPPRGRPRSRDPWHPHLHRRPCRCHRQAPAPGSPRLRRVPLPALHGETRQGA